MSAADTASDADVIVVGAGPAGSSAAYWLASAGLDVVVLEKTSFPREKVCGDGLTPRGTKALVDMGIDVSESNGWLHNRGLRIMGGGQRLHLDWPDLTSYPPFGLVRPRADLDAMLATQAVKAGARLYENTSVTEPILDNAGRVVGVAGKTLDKKPVRYRAPLVLSCEGVSGKLAQHLGVHRNDKRPLGVAVRRYYTSPRTHDDYLESWLELWAGPPNASPLLPGYGWIFGMGDGTVNVGLGVLNSSAGFQKTDYRSMLTRWLDNTPDEWGLREENATCTHPRRRAADGLQPHAALQPRAAARRRLGRLGQPVQRRGHPLRDGVRPVRGRGGRPGARPPGRAEPGERAGRLPGPDARGVGCLLPTRRAVREADRAPARDAVRHPARPAPSDADALRPQAVGQPARPAGSTVGDVSDRIINTLQRLTPPVR